MTRAGIFAEFAAASVKTDEGLALRTDDAIERLWHRWIQDGRPSGVTVGIDSAGDGNELHWIDPQPVSADIFANF